MNSVPNSVVLMFVRGWQGGTIHQIAHELGVTPSEVETASLSRMGELMRLAQTKRVEAAGPRATGVLGCFVRREGLRTEFLRIDG